jgi:hypothetical protein
MSALKDSKDVLRQGAVRTIERRAFLKQSLSLGALTLLTGCDVTDQDSVQTALNAVWRRPIRKAPRSRTSVTTPITARMRCRRSTERASGSASRA